MWRHSMEHFVADFNDSGTDDELNAAHATDPTVYEE